TTSDLIVRSAIRTGRLDARFVVEVRPRAIIAFSSLHEVSTSMVESELHGTGECGPESLLGPLNDIERKFAPRWIWHSGHLEILAHGPRVAVVGSRKLSSAGAQRTRSLAEFLVAKGIVVVSGLAEGADTIAHKTAIAEGGRTIAVVGTPLQTCYP